MPNDTALKLAAGQDVAATALAGLLREPKTLPAKLFYDEAGCRLFAQITDLPEYYLTRTERMLLETLAPQVAALQPNSVLVEYGASDETKAEFLLSQCGVDGAPLIRAYVPIDVAAPSLHNMQVRLRQARPYLQVHAIVADFMDALRLPTAVASLPPLGFFPGSTIGNLDPPAAATFLQHALATLGRRPRLLIGVDLRKDAAVLLPAYDDAAGVTAAFNRNLLVRLNREADADFDPLSFDHRAIWNDRDSRIEMHLVSRRSQTVRVHGHVIHFAPGESIHTENSYKYTAEGFASLCAAAGWQSAELWIDESRLFSVHLLESRHGP